ncbi:hypothetical protein DL1_11915 [Thioclava dalianensis]|uniref:Uncharacterized protein n=1 Tax=Thioclava dalianensis TaxID=1185766 RepID=A0A074THC7_9RHOB|nr:hypothetical protein [Thioclava dalianensis]KEP68433.1 hypothetical protein DL1_11915 [Thioclava dalianensis]SFN62531.1 hypothetical protein SAMN05216224_10847 [Thioclava dalianensis]
MFIHVKSTRHTKIGTLRRGVVYRLDDENSNAQAVVAAHSKGTNPALKKVSEAEAKKLAAKFVSLEAKADSELVEERSDSEELSAQFETMTAALTEARDTLAAERAKLAERDAKIAELAAALEGAEKQRDDVIAEAAEQKEKLDELQALVAEKDDQKPKQDGKK